MISTKIQNSIVCRIRHPMGQYRTKLWAMNFFEDRIRTVLFTDNSKKTKAHELTTKLNHVLYMCLEKADIC
jgi:hypothetical protein